MGEKYADNIPIGPNLDINNLERQYLVNYLVHLEGVAALVNEGVLLFEGNIQNGYFRLALT